MKKKYRIIEHPYCGLLSGKIRIGYIIEEKSWLFGWLTYDDGYIFDTFEEAEDYLKKIVLKEKVVVGEY